MIKVTEQEVSSGEAVLTLEKEKGYTIARVTLTNISVWQNEKGQKETLFLMGKEGAKQTIEELRRIFGL